MTGIFPIHIYRTQLGQIVRFVFKTMLSVDVEPAEGEWSPHADAITSAVYFAGDWKGAVILECTREQALEFTSRLMVFPPPDTGSTTALSDDVRDTVGELANMLAGNMKSVLPRGVALSMPSVVEGSDYTLQICGKALVDRVPFQSSLGNFWAMLVEMQQ